MLAAAGPRAEISGIAVFEGPAGILDYEIGWSELEREEAWAARLVDHWGVRAGERVVLCVPNHDYAWAGPLITAVRARRGVYSPVEVFSWDSRRLTTFLRNEPVSAVIGMSGETAQAIAGSETIELLGAVPTLIVSPEARTVLRAEGLVPAVISRIGPALGLECAERSGLHVDPGEWALTVSGGTVHVSSRAARAHSFSDLDTGLAGELTNGPCACGLPGPRVVLA